MDHKGAVCKTVTLRVELEDAAGQIATQSPEASPRENFLLYLQGHLRRAGPYGLDVSSEGRMRAAEGK